VILPASDDLDRFFGHGAYAVAAEFGCQPISSELLLSKPWSSTVAGKIIEAKTYPLPGPHTLIQAFNSQIFFRRTA